MKKILLSLVAMAAFVPAVATDLPEPSIQVLPQSYGWFDAFSISWADEPQSPFHLEIIDDSGIKVTKNGVEDIGFSTGLTEFQENEDSQNYPESVLVITLDMIQSEIGALYSLEIPAGAINITVADSETVPNSEVLYSFTLTEDGTQVSLPEPNIDPMPGTVKNLSVIKLSWTGVLGTLDLLNENNSVNPNADIAPVSLTCNGENLSNPTVGFEWSERTAATPGSAGDILVLTLTDDDSLQDGEYIITIPKDYLQITDIETGTLYNNEIIISYIVDSEMDDSNAVDSIIDNSGSKIMIYDLKGTPVNSQDLNSLPKGIYIVNGKKINIK